MNFSVGVTGHRWNGLRDADVQRLVAQVNSVLEYIQQTVGKLDPAISLCLFSPVAEGSDRIVATVALKLAYELHCVLPFARHLYEEDFESTKSKEEFREFLEKAETVLELPNQPVSSATRNAAYTAAGRKVTAESAVLLALWDGREARGEGGTGQMVEEALEHSHPVIWINAKAPHNVYLLNPDGTQETLSALSKFIEKRVQAGETR
jgi:hypothetical protein